MKFGTFSLDEALGAILAHSLRAGSRHLKKGTVLDEMVLAQFADAGITHVIAARLEAGDVGEDAAAARIAAALGGANTSVSAAFTGRANILSAVDGVARIDRDLTDALNRLDESMTVASLRDFDAVRDGQMVATVKIIRFAVAEALVRTAEALAARGPEFAIVPFVPHRAGLIVTSLAQTKPSLIDKSIAGIEQRLQRCGSVLGRHIVCGHDSEAVASALRELIAGEMSPVLIFGASAIVDRGDVVPAAVIAAGGEVDHLGMPVDPGNLLMLGRMGEVPVIGVPGCARSPVLNGFDWVLERALAGLMVAGDDIQVMGYGGLLKEIPTRPQPRAGDRGGPRDRALPAVAVIVLAAGQSRRMGRRNKLLEPIGGVAMVRRVVENALGSTARPVVVVTGHEDGKVRAALEGLDVSFVHNRDYAGGLSSSLGAGLRALPENIIAAAICLGDMPGISAGHIDQLIAAFDVAEGRTICVPVFDGKRGNPVLWGREYFDEMMTVSGDVGARHLIGRYESDVCEVPFDQAGILDDIDTPADLAMARGEA